MFGNPDYLPQTASVSALIRRIVWRLDGHLAFNGHPILTMNERASLFDLGEASRILDRIAILPRMAQHEESARARLLDVYSIFDHEPLEATLEQPPQNSYGQRIFAHEERLDRARGFTLIELMIVLAIVGILAAIAIPAYQDYVVRSQVTEGLTLASGLKPGIAEFYASNGRMPSHFEQTAQASPSGRFVESIALLQGALIVRYGGDSAEQLRDEAHNSLALVPGVSAGGSMFWQCGRAAQPVGDDIEWAGDAVQLTTIEAKYLPTSCR